MKARTTKFDPDLMKRKKEEFELNSPQSAPESVASEEEEDPEEAERKRKEAILKRLQGGGGPGPMAMPGMGMGPMGMGMPGDMAALRKGLRSSGQRPQTMAPMSNAGMADLRAALRKTGSSKDLEGSQ